MGKYLKLGITGLRRSGKTVFISTLVHLLEKGGNLDGVKCVDEGRFIGAEVIDQIPFGAIGAKRFEHKKHIDKILNELDWPDPSKNVRSLCLEISFKTGPYIDIPFKGKQYLRKKKLYVEILDYPGELLLDLPLLGLDYKEWSDESILKSMAKIRKKIAREWHEKLEEVDPNSKFDEHTAKMLVNSFRRYLLKCKKSEITISRMPPGKFLLIDDENPEKWKPHFFFAPLHLDKNTKFRSGSLGQVFQNNYDQYKKIEVKPFVKNFISKLDRQIILVDVLPAITSGRDSFFDLQKSLSQILNFFKFGKTTFLEKLLFKHKIDRVVVAGTKADHILSSDDKNYKNLLRNLTDCLDTQKGPTIDHTVIASVISTKPVLNKSNTIEIGLEGIPLKGEVADEVIFDGKKSERIRATKVPRSIDAISEQPISDGFISFRPKINFNPNSKSTEIQHKNLDETIELLIGDKLK